VTEMDQQRVVHGPFHRRWAEDVQDADTIVRQLLSGELWGKAARFSDEASAKAYRGSLPPDEEGFEFWSFQPPDNQHGPRAYWRKLGDFLVAADNVHVVKLKIAFVTITQSLHSYAR
jgi:hypothetical protein